MVSISFSCWFGLGYVRFAKGGGVVQDLWHTGLPEDDNDREKAFGLTIP
jgi:hypothetical protein